MNERATNELASFEEQKAYLPRVLIVDDHFGIGDMLCHVFALDGYTATACAAGDAWIDRAMQLDPPPALLLLDLSFPPTDALAFLHFLRDRWKAIPPLLVMTTNKDVYDALVPLERVIRKPFHLCDIRREVQMLLPHATE